MKKILCMVTMLVCAICLVGCDKTNNGLEFKNDYESMNGKVNASGVAHRKVTIDENNPFVFSTTKEILSKINKNETFYVYFGDKQCPWCRSVIEKAIEVANKYNIKKIYYINIWDDNHNEILRDVYNLDENNKPVLKSEGTSDYKYLLEKFENVLDDYELSTEDGGTVKVGEKRIYAPNFIYIEKGKPVEKIAGYSNNQTNSREELTSELLKDEEKIFTEFFNR